MKKLYKTIVETELVVLARNESEADKIGLENAPGEMASGYGRSRSILIEDLSQISKEWANSIPYSLSPEPRNCLQILSVEKKQKKILQNDDIDDIITVRKKIRKVDDENDGVNDVKTPETRPDPKPKELEWKDTKTGRQLPHLRFKL